MSTRRVRDVDYDDDDLYDGEYDDEEGEEQMSPEDRAQLKQSVAAVKEALQTQISLPDAEIEETVWHYYFDVDKSVAYLKTKHAPKETKKPKQAAPVAKSKFDLAAEHAQVNDHPFFSRSLSTGPGFQPSMHELFKDVPWLRVPPERLATITPVPMTPRGGLLGGSGGKPSKLAALAAARKKAQADKKAAESGHAGENASVALLDRLSIQPDASASASSSGGKRASPGPAEPAAPRKYLRPKRTEAPKPEATTAMQPMELDASPTEPVPEPEEAAVPEDIRTEPSIFASVMLGSAAQINSSRANDIFTLPPIHQFNSDAFTKPSPDDIVLQAQTKGNKAAAAGAAKPPTSSLSNLSLQDNTQPSQPRPKSKNINVPEVYLGTSPKNAANFVVIGHVDHGKSTLMGRLLYDLKLYDERSFTKLSASAAEANKSSFSFAWIMDSTAEERARGVTVDIATNHFETSKTRFTILDAPGHRDFIPNMIAGAAQADFAVLVVDASTNAFEAGLRGQTREHALLARSMGLSRIIVAVNKMDAAAWSEARFAEIEAQMRAFLTTAGFPPKGIVFVPCAGLTGENIARALPAGTAAWYTGGTLVDALDAAEPSRRALADPLRMTVNDVYRKPHASGVSVAGRIDAGSLQVGGSILALPSGEHGYIRAVDVESESRDWAVAGQIAELALEDIDAIHLRAGDVLCNPAESPLSNVTAFTAKVLAFEHVFPGPVELHKGRMHAPATVAGLVAVLNKASGAVEKKKPKIVKPGMLARVRLELETPLPLEAPGRVVLRSEGVTVAAGLIEGVEK